MHRILLAALLLFSLNSCRREGQTGELKLTVNPKHHDLKLKGATIYVRYGATDLPGTSPTDFDLKVESAADAEFVTIEKLRNGDYFLYGIGYDSTISQTVSGGIHIKLKGKTGETITDLPLTE